MSKAMVLVLEPTGNFTITRLPGGEGGANLAALQKMVGGYIEAVTDDEAFGHIYLNEEGKLMALPQNLVATAILDGYIPGFAKVDVLVGNVVWLDSDDQGDSADIRPETLRDILNRVLHPGRTWAKVTHGDQVEIYDDGTEAVLNVKALAGRLRQDPGFGDILVQVTP